MTFEYQAKQPRRERPRIPHVWVSGEEKKSCGGCGSLKSVDDFEDCASNWDFKTELCVKCIKKRVHVREKDSKTSQFVPKIDSEAREEARNRLLYIEEERVRREKALREAARASIERLREQEEAQKRLAASLKRAREVTVPVRCLTCLWGGKRSDTRKSNPCPKCGSKVILGRPIEQKEP